MRVILLLLLLLATQFASVLNAQNRYWVGVSGGLWSANANWAATSGGAGGASYPVTTNDVFFDNGFNGVVDMDVLSATTFQINSLHILNSSNVTLKRTQATGGERVLQINSNSVTNVGLDITAGAVLNIEANALSGSLNLRLSLTGTNGVTGEIFGELNFKGSGGADFASLRLQTGVDNYADLKVKSGGIICYLPNTGNTSPGSGNYLTMENGSTYAIEKTGGSFPTGNWAPNSLAKLTNLTGTALPLFNGTQYGNVEINIPNLTSSLNNGDHNLEVNNLNLLNTNSSHLHGEIKIKTGTSLTSYSIIVNGNLSVSSNSRIKLATSTVSSGFGGTLVVKGDIINDGTISTEGTSGTINDFIINGDAAQSFTQTGQLTGSNIKFVVNKPTNHLTLLSDITFPGHIFLDNGNVITTNGLLTIKSGFNAYNFSSSSFVAGPMKKIGNNAFIFPVGKGEILSPIHIPAGGTVTDEFTAEYHRINPHNTISNTYEAPINHISYVEYWTLDMPSTTAVRSNITVSVHEYSFARNNATLLLAQNDGVDPIWKNRGYAGGGFSTLGSGYVTGTYSNNLSIPIDRGRYFTLATTEAFAMNPLPVKLISFTGKKSNQHAVQLSWRLAEQLKDNKMVDIQKAAKPDGPFVTITRKNMENNLYATYLDEGVTETTYYRLAFKNEEGSTVYSNTLRVDGDHQSLEIVKVYPTLNPANYLVITSHVTTGMEITWTIYNIEGKAVVTMKENLVNGTNQSQLPVAYLPNGIYVIKGITSNTKIVTYKFVK